MMAKKIKLSAKKVTDAKNIPYGLTNGTGMSFCKVTNASLEVRGYSQTKGKLPS